MKSELCVFEAKRHSQELVVSPFKGKCRLRYVHHCLMITRFQINNTKPFGPFCQACPLTVVEAIFPTLSDYSILGNLLQYGIVFFRFHRVTKGLLIVDYRRGTYFWDSISSRCDLIISLIPNGYLLGFTRTGFSPSVRCSTRSFATSPPYKSTPHLFNFI